jgi:hypothetical protein
MIIDREVEIKLNSSNIKHYINMGYVLPNKPSGKIITVNIEHISNSSFVKINAKCDYCGQIKEIEYYRYKIIISKHNKFSCSNKCSVIKRKITQLDKYGVDNYTKTDEYKSRVSKSNMDKYGVVNVFQSEIIKNKIKNTNLCKYGVDNISKSELNHSNTLIGKDINYIKYLDNYVSLFNCEKGHNFEITSDSYHSRIRYNTPLCTVCNPIGDQKSIKEKELLDFIKNIYSGKIISSYRDSLEIDIYLPELKIGFEFNGLYFHSNKFKEKNYHLDKTNYFKEREIRIIHIWEDDWIFKNDIIKSQIKNILYLKSERIFARKCKVIEIKDSKIVSKFLNENHIQGKVNSSFKLGLYYNNELVSIMTFDHFEGRNKMYKGGWNLNRFCNKLNTNVIGGASKLLSYFIKNCDVKRIISYVDKDWSIGGLYYKLGFKNVGGNGPDYKYIIDNRRIHKSRYKKSNLKTELTESKQMELNGINKIYDCGKLKFEMSIS